MHQVLKLMLRRSRHTCLQRAPIDPEGITSLKNLVRHHHFLAFHSPLPKTREVRAGIADIETVDWVLFIRIAQVVVAPLILALAAASENSLRAWTSVTGSF